MMLLINTGRDEFFECEDCDFICYSLDEKQQHEEEECEICPSTGEKGHAVWEFDNHDQKCLDCGKVL